MAGLQDHTTSLTKSTIIAGVLQIALVAVEQYSGSGSTGTLAQVGQPTVAGIAGLLFSLMAKGQPVQPGGGVAATGGVVAGGVSGLVGQLAGQLMGTPMGNLPQNTAISGGAGAIGAVLGQLISKMQQPKA